MDLANLKVFGFSHRLKVEDCGIKDCHHDHNRISSHAEYHQTIAVIPIALSYFLPVILRKNEPAGLSLAGSLSLLKMPVLRKVLVSSALVLYSRDIFAAYFPLFSKRLNMVQLSDLSLCFMSAVYC